MIVIKARGARDVKALRRLAGELSTTSMSAIAAAEIDIAPQEVAPAQQRRGRRPTVSTLPCAAISPQTQAAIFELRPVAVEESGDYDLT